MPIDPSIPLRIAQQGGGFAGNLMQGVQRGIEGFPEQQRRKRLADLLPPAMGRGGVGEQGALSQKDAIAQLYAIDPNLAMKLDDRQRQQARELTSDLSNAVRWADSPEKWQYVQQHYGQKGVDLSPYRFEDRERGLMTLGKLGDYLKDPPKPDIRATEPGGGLYAVDPATGNVRVLVQPNDGSQPMGAPAQQGGLQNLPRVSSPEEARRLPPGSKFIMPDGRVGTVPGGPTASQSGGFPY